MKQLFTLLALAVCSTSYGQLTNGTMEAWHSYTVGTSPSMELPDGWHSTDTIIYGYGPLICSTCTLTPETFQSTTSHSGTYAAKLMSRDLGGTIGVVGDELSNCNISFNISTQKEIRSGGTAVTQRMDSITAWFEYFPKGNDSGNVSVYAVLAGMGAGGADSIVGGAVDSTTLGTGRDNYILATSTYTKHKYTLSYINSTVVPDHIQINFSTGSGGSTSTDSTTLYVDDVNIYPLSSTAVPLFGGVATRCYPNPAGNTLHIQTAQYQNTTAELYNMLGQKVMLQSLQSNITEMNISNLSDGLYLLHLLDKNNTIIYQTKIAKQQ